MKSLFTLLKLALALAVLYALWNAGQSFWRNYLFQDALAQTAAFGTRSSEDQVRARVMKSAAELGVPVTADQVSVRREADKLVIEASYVDRIKIFPSYFYPYRFRARGEALILP